MVRRGSALLFALVLWSAAPAWAYLSLEVRPQFRYELFQARTADGQKISDGNFSTNYNLSVRGPVLPSSRLLLDVTTNRQDSSTTVGERRTDDTAIALRANEDNYSLNLSRNMSRFRSTFIVAEGGSVVSSGSSSSGTVDFQWQQVDWPLINLQYRAFNSELTGGRSSYNLRQWLAGASYENRPFRFAFESSLQDVRFAGLTSFASRQSRRAYDASFDQELISGLRLYADLQREFSDTKVSSGTGTDISGLVRTIRLSAQPTPAVVLTGESSLQDWTQRFAATRSRSTGKTDRISMRAQVVQGASLSLVHAISDDSTDGFASRSVNSSAVLNLALGADSTLSLGASSMDLDSEPGANRVSVRNLYGNLLIPAAADIDLVLDLSRSTSKTNLGASRTSSDVAITLRSYEHPDLTFSGSFRLGWLDSTGPGTAGDQRSSAIDVSALWSPSSELTINGRLSRSLTSGRTSSRYLAPALGILLRPSSEATINLSYDSNSSEFLDWTSGQTSLVEGRTASARLSYRLPQGHQIDFSYDIQRVISPLLSWQRMLRMIYTARF